MATSCHHFSASNHRNVSAVMLILVYLIVFDSIFLEIMAIRPLAAEQRWRNNIVIQSLPRGRVPASRSSPCTYIPGGKSRGRCAMAVGEGRHSGHAVGAPPVAAALPPSAASEWWILKELIYSLDVVNTNLIFLSYICFFSFYFGCDNSPIQIWLNLLERVEGNHGMIFNFLCSKKYCYTFHLKQILF